MQNSKFVKIYSMQKAMLFKIKKSKSQKYVKVKSGKKKVGKYATLHSATQNLLGPASDAEEYEKKGKESFIIQMIHC